MKQLTFISAFFFSFSFSYQQFSDEDINGLRLTITEFQNVWYVEKSESKFWSYVASSSHMHGQSHYFSGAFTAPLDEVNPSDLAIWGVSPREIYEKYNSIIPINVGTDDKFELHHGTNKNLIEHPSSFLYDDAHIEEGRELGYIPRQDFMIAVYGVEGEGYLDEGMITIWVKEDGGWKFFSFMAFD